MTIDTPPPPTMPPDDAGLAIPSDRIAVRRAEFTSQATQVEQARAVAEVQAAVIVAQQVPRNMPHVIGQMREACAQRGLADRAFFKFPRGGQSITGASIHLARELARVYGNVQYGIHELRRDDVGRYSEMQAWAWDVETNTRTSTTFVVPHKRDKGGSPEVLTALRDVYENNANAGARRVREMIFAILPAWFTEEAKERCMATMAQGGGEPLAQRIAKAIEMYDGIGVKVDRLESRHGPSAKWTPHDVALLGVAFKSIEKGEVKADEEFPPERVTVDEIAATTKPAPRTTKKATPEADTTETGGE